MRLTLALSITALIVLPFPIWAADPFAPPENVQLFYQVVYPDTSETPIEYKMYMQSGGKIIALLNTTFVSEGDKFQGFKVMSVNNNRVILLSPAGSKRVIVIDAMQSKLQKLREMMNEENR